MHQEGWAYPGNSRKAHYMRNMESLCGRYGFFNAPTQPDDGKPSPSDCAKCRKLCDAETAP